MLRRQFKALRDSTDTTILRQHFRVTALRRPCWDGNSKVLRLKTIVATRRCICWGVLYCFSFSQDATGRNKLFTVSALKFVKRCQHCFPPFKNFVLLLAWDSKRNFDCKLFWPYFPSQLVLYILILITKKFLRANYVCRAVILLKDFFQHFPSCLKLLFCEVTIFTSRHNNSCKKNGNFSNIWTSSFFKVCTAFPTSSFMSESCLNCSWSLW